MGMAISMAMVISMTNVMTLVLRFGGILDWLSIV